MSEQELVRRIMSLEKQLERVQAVEYPQAIRLLSSTASVSLAGSSKTALYTVPAGRSCVVTHVVVRAASTNLNTASYGFGFDAGASDVIAGATHTELTGSTLYTVLTAKAGAKAGAAGDIFGIKCSATQSATVTIDVFGRIY